MLLDEPLFVNLIIIPLSVNKFQYIYIILRNLSVGPSDKKYAVWTVW